MGITKKNHTNHTKMKHLIVLLLLLVGVQTTYSQVWETTEVEIESVLYQDNHGLVEVEDTYNSVLSVNADTLHILSKDSTAIAPWSLSLDLSKVELINSNEQFAVYYYSDFFKEVELLVCRVPNKYHEEVLRVIALSTEERVGASIFIIPKDITNEY